MATVALRAYESSDLSICLDLFDANTPAFFAPNERTDYHTFLAENPNPTEEEIRHGISGNLCRCTGYNKIVEAIQYAAEKLQSAEAGGE